MFQIDEGLAQKKYPSATVKCWRNP